jgi:hypothetical protein
MERHRALGASIAFNLFICEGRFASVRAELGVGSVGRVGSVDGLDSALEESMACNPSTGEVRYACFGSGVTTVGGGAGDSRSALECDTFRGLRFLGGGALKDSRLPPGASIAAINLSIGKLAIPGTGSGA